MYKYKNITKEDLNVIGVGIVKAGEVVTLDYEVNNANLQRVVTKKTESEKNKEEEN